MFSVILATTLLAATASAQSFYYATDINQRGTATSFSCLRNSNYATVFIRAYRPEASGTADASAVPNVNMAYNAGLGIEVYITPSPTSNKPGYQQVDEAINNLVNGGITIRSLWIQVTSPVNWSSSQISNVNFINSAIQRIRARGIRPGVYTNTYDWQQITNSASGIGSDVMLWYWNVFGQGPNGESAPNFSDFRGFGNWNAAAVKQFGQYESLCGFTLNRDVYPASSINIKDALTAMKKATEEKKIVAGYIGL